MAKIWPVFEGKHPTYGGPWAELPFSEAIGLFELRPTDFLSGPAVTPRFGDAERDLTWTGFKHIVVEVNESETSKLKWKPGFYRSKVKPKEAFRRLLQHAVTPAFGAENIVRVDYEPTTDSLGQDALRITLVLTPNAIKRLAGGGVLDALVRLQDRLHEMREYRTPIIEYATEAELAQDAGP
jgi:hypothetical protein